MKLAELQQALRTADPAAVLVAPRVLERVIQQVYRLPKFIWKMPHRRSCVVDRHVLFRHVDQDDLDLEPDQLLPPTVILLARPSMEWLNNSNPAALLLRYWRRLFHATIHLTLECRSKEGTLTAADIRGRIDQIGAVEFEEIRNVLLQESYLLPDADERSVYIEFAAVYLELRFFAANLLPTYFPAIRDFDALNRLLAQDLDADALFALTHLKGAAAPVLPEDTRSDEAHFFYWKLMQSAERAAETGNIVRSAILHTKAARVAPAALTHSTRAQAEDDLKRLTQRLQAALELSAAEAGEWLKDLPALLDKADQGNRPVEGEILFDLQKVCLDHERDIYALDLVEWVSSGGKRPIKRPLPGQRIVRINKHLRSAEQRLTAARLSDLDRKHFGRLLGAALKNCQEQLRAKFRPIVASALQDVGLVPANPPERAAFHKIIEEMVDRIGAYGFLTFSDLRDTLSRNQLKLSDLMEPQEYVKGDPLLRLDRRLGTLLDGVYRPSELYSRILQRLSALGFGTATGRAITRYFTIPFGAAFVIVEASKLVFDHFRRWFTPGPVEASAESYLPGPGSLFLIALVGVFIMGMLNSPRIRHWVVQAWAQLRQLGRVVVHEVLLEFIPIETLNRAVHTLNRAVRSWPLQLFYWYLLKPVVACLLLYALVPDAFATPVGGAAVVLATGIVLNSRFGQAVSEALLQAALEFYELLRAGLLPGLFRWIVRAFKEVIEMLEYVLFTVDEWLRFRSGDSRLSLVLRTLLALLWFPISYLARFYMVVLIEPGINPIKLPISSVAAKFMYTAMFTSEWMTNLREVLASHEVLLYGIVVPTVWLLPDAFGYFFWEIKENWRLYRANRSPILQPEVIGAHGETLPRYLQPGFHSGTIPRLFARLREAERAASDSNDWRAVRRYRHELHEVEKSLQLFVERDMIVLLHESASWRGRPLSVGQVELASNRIELELLHATVVERPVWLSFEDRAGWIVAHIRQRGWLDALPAEQSQTFAAALASLYKLAGVDIVVEQVAANFPATIAGIDVTAADLVVWLDHRQGRSVLYSLTEPQDRLQPRFPAGSPATETPVLDTQQVIYRDLPLCWSAWLDYWQIDLAANGRPGLFSGGMEMRLIGQSPTPGAIVPGVVVLPDQDAAPQVSSASEALNASEAMG